MRIVSRAAGPPKPGRSPSTARAQGRASTGLAARGRTASKSAISSSPTPARLKFLKSDRTELEHAVEWSGGWRWRTRRSPSRVADGERSLLRLPASTAARGPAGAARRVLGRDFDDNALPIEAAREGASAHPATPGCRPINRGTAARQYLFVNGRPVRDSLLLGAVRGAYADFLRARPPSGGGAVPRLPPPNVDVNVHPAKTEVRFRDAGAGARPDRRCAEARAGGGRASAPRPRSRPCRSVGSAPHGPAPPSIGAGWPTRFPAGLAERAGGRLRAVRAGGSGPSETLAGRGRAGRRAGGMSEAIPLGAARAQLHGTYIVAADRRRHRHRRPACGA